MSEISHFHAIAIRIADALACLFALAALLHLLAPPFLRRAYQAFGYARSFLYVVGTAAALTALFLLLPQTRIWGGVLGGLMLFVAVTALLNRARYAWALPLILLLAALAPAMA